MGGACNAHAEKFLQGFCGEKKIGGNRPLGKNVGVHGRIILNSILKKYKVRLWIGFARLGCCNTIRYLPVP